MLDVPPRPADVRCPEGGASGRGWLLLLLATLGLAVVALGAPAGVSAKPLYGIQGVPALPAAGQAQVDTALNAAQAAHAKVIRVEAVWSLLEPKAAGQRDDAALTAIDRVVAGASARSMKVVLMIDSTPCWASSAPGAGSCSGSEPSTTSVTRYPPSDPRDYVHIATFLAARYGPALAAFEVWNEPDQINELYWAGPDKIKGYVALAKAVYGPLKRVNPKVPVLAGSFVGADGRWLQALYDAGLKGSYDALAVHFYDLPLTALTTTRGVQRRNGDNKPLWLSEFGFTSCFQPGGAAFMIDHPCVTRAGQAQNLVDTLRKVATVSWLKAAITYTLNDQSDAYQFGLLTAADVRKPAYDAVQKVFAGLPVAVTRPRMTLRPAKGRVVVSGSASQVEVFTLRVWRNGTLAYRANLRTDRFGAYRLTLPAVLGTSGLRATLSGRWTGSITRRR